MGNIVIITDSACDLELNYIKENNIILLPLTIEINGISYKDIIDLKPERFYDLIENKNVCPKTSSLKLCDFQRVFRRELDLGN